VDPVVLSGRLTRLVAGDHFLGDQHLRVQDGHSAARAVMHTSAEVPTVRNADGSVGP
jgi:hypothetical protein